MHSKNESQTIQPYKEILYYPDSGKYALWRTNGKEFECNIYGERAPKFKEYYSGFTNYDNRVKTGTLKKLDHNIDTSLYHAQGQYVEGYCPFPRPLSMPFINLKGEDKTKLHDALVKEKRMTLPKNKHLLTLKVNQGIHYMSSTIDVKSDKDKKILVKLIDETLKEEKAKEKNSGRNLNFSAHDLKALKKFKRLMIANDKNKIFKRKLPLPKEEFRKNFRAIQSALFERPIEKIKERNKKEVHHSKKRVSLSMEANSKKKDELYFLSTQNQEEKKELVKKSSCLLRQSELEKRLLVGYKAEPEKEKGIIQKETVHNMQTRGDLYNKELALISKVNPIFVKNEEEKNKKDKVFFEKKKRKEEIKEQIIYMKKKKCK